MASDARDLRPLVLILAVGALLRFTLAGVNPPNNTYDNHLEPVAVYAEEAGRPSPDACWQCYQPPLYYWIGEDVATAAQSVTDEARTAWEAVQWISAVASVGTLLFCLLLLRLYLPESQMAQLGGLTLVSILPRELYTAASLSNDALLVCFVSAALYCFALIHRKNQLTWGVVGLAAAAVLAAWTKQSGLVTLALLGLASLTVWRRAEPGARRGALLSVLVLALFLAMADEAWRTYQTGMPLVSNQHFDYRALQEGQPPGTVSVHTFTSWLPIKLWKHPTLHPSTVDSFWTQLFARTWFDYEPRFFPTNSGTLWLARSLYLVGGMVTLIAVGGVVRVLRNGSPSARSLLLVATGFLAAALFQTVRFPHFSSMKALFVLPGLGVFAVCFGFGIQALQERREGRRLALGLLVVLAVLGLAHWTAALALNDEALNLATSPLWPFPPL